MEHNKRTGSDTRVFNWDFANKTQMNIQFYGHNFSTENVKLNGKVSHYCT